MPTPLVSILIPCFNAAPWLAETIESALAQTWPKSEIIVVDDGSTDQSFQIASNYVSRGVLVLKQSNQGASAARNAAFAACHGSWIQYLDADDLMSPDKIERQMHLAAEHGEKHIICASWARFNLSAMDAAFTPQPLCMDSNPLEWVLLKALSQKSLMMHPAAWLLSRDLVERAGPWDERLSLDDDGEFFNRAVLRSEGVRFCAQAISYYRSNVEGSLSGRQDSRAWRSAYLSTSLTVDQVLSVEDSARTRQACAAMFQRLIYCAYPDCPEVVGLCRDQVHLLGGTSLRPEVGPRLKFVSQLIGWKMAKRLKNLVG